MLFTANGLFTLSSCSFVFTLSTAVGLPPVQHSLRKSLHDHSATSMSCKLLFGPFCIPNMTQRGILHLTPTMKKDSLYRKEKTV